MTTDLANFHALHLKQIQLAVHSALHAWFFFLIWFFLFCAVTHVFESLNLWWTVHLDCVFSPNVYDI